MRHRTAQVNPPCGAKCRSTSDTQSRLRVLKIESIIDIAQRAIGSHFEHAAAAQLDTLPGTAEAVAGIPEHECAVVSAGVWPFAETSAPGHDAIERQCARAVGDGDGGCRIVDHHATCHDAR